MTFKRYVVFASRTHRNGTHVRINLALPEALMLAEHALRLPECDRVSIEEQRPHVGYVETGPITSLDDAMRGRAFPHDALTQLFAVV